MMVWVVIVLVFLVAFGPILWLMPSKRDKRLSALRQQAYRQGMRVEMRRLPKQDPSAEERVSPGGRERDLTREYAAYIHPLGRRLRMLPRWRVLRGSDGLAALPGWIFAPGSKPDHPRLDAALAVVAPVLEAMPEDVLAVECESQSVAGYWTEAPGTTPDRVQDLGQRLEDAARHLNELDARLQAEADERNI